MKKTYKSIINYGLLVAALIAAAGLVYAAFADKGSVLGSSFQVASSDLKMLDVLSGGTGESNLKDQLAGPSFTNITPNWQNDYLVKIFNNGSSTVHLTSNADYLTANDPDDLRSLIYVEPIEWNDVNNDGALDTGEEGVSLGKKTIVKWKTEGFDLGTLAKNQIKGLLLRFSTMTIGDTKQGKTGIYDFVFDAVQE